MRPARRILIDNWLHGRRYLQSILTAAQPVMVQMRLMYRSFNFGNKLMNDNSLLRGAPCAKNNAKYALEVDAAPGWSPSVIICAN